MTVRMPPEWAPQDWLWIGFPHDAEEWPEVLSRAQEQIAAFANAVAAIASPVPMTTFDHIHATTDCAPVVYARSAASRSCSRKSRR